MDSTTTTTETTQQTAQRLLATHGMRKALEIANGLASCKGARGFRYWKVVKALHQLDRAGGAL